MMAGPDKRRWPRYETKWRAEFPLATAAKGSFRVVNASLRGMFVAMSKPLPVGTKLVAEVTVGERTLPMGVKVIHRVVASHEGSSPNGVGMELLVKTAAWEQVVMELGG